MNRDPIAQVLDAALGRPADELDADTAHKLAAHLRAVAAIAGPTPRDRALRRDLLAAAQVLDAA